MRKEEVVALSEKHKSNISVAYLVRNKEERPEGTERMFHKLEGYEGSLSEMLKAIDNAKRTIMELEDKQLQLYGSVNTIVEIIGEMLPKEKLSEWCEKYEPPKNIKDESQKKDISKPGGGPIKEAGDIDMAGSTSGGSPVPGMQNSKEQVPNPVS